MSVFLSASLATAFAVLGACIRVRDRRRKRQRRPRTRRRGPAGGVRFMVSSLMITKSVIYYLALIGGAVASWRPGPVSPCALQKALPSELAVWPQLAVCPSRDRGVARSLTPG